MPASMSAARKFIAFCISGMIGGLCGYLWVSRYVIASVEIANGYELNVIAACVIGGISIAGGIGSVGGAVLGALFLGVIDNALPVINVSPFWQMAISGAPSSSPWSLNARGERRQRPHHPASRRRRVSRMTDTAARADIPDRLDNAARARRSCCAGRRCCSCVRGRDLRRQQLRLALFPRPVLAVATLTFNFTEKALIALAMALLIIVRRDRPLGRRDHRARLDADGHGGAGRRRHAGAGRRSASSSALACGAFNGLLVTRLGAALDRRHHRHDEPVPRHRLHHPRRPGLQGLSRRASPSSARAMSGGWSRSSSCSSSSRRSSTGSCCTARVSAAASSPSATIRSRRSFPACASTASSSSCSA